MIEPEDLADYLRVATNSGGSGRGLSFWSEAAKCGKRALLYEERRAHWDDDPSSVPAFDPDKKSAFAVGSVYHKLHEMWAQGQLSDDLLARVPPIYDASVALGLHLFLGWRAHFPVNFWGQDVAIELTLPLGEWAENTMKHELGAVVNAKPDRVVYMDREALERVNQRHPEIRREGFYMVDFKTTGADYDSIYYREGLQNYWYPVAWELDNPDKPLEGFVYDLIRKPNPRAKDQTITRDNFPTPVFIPHRPRDLSFQTVKGLIAQGRANLERSREKGLGNRSHCISIGFGKVEVCPFFHRECGGA